MEIRPQPEHRSTKLRRSVFALFGACAVMSGTAACSPSSSNPEHALVTLIPNLSGFTLKDPTKCLNGGPRPCAIALRAGPERSAAYINTTPSGNAYVSWPLESYAGQSGDPVTIECYVAHGERLFDTSGRASSVWYKVAVPVGRIINPAERPSDPNQQTVPGYASILWFGETAVDSRVPAC